MKIDESLNSNNFSYNLNTLNTILSDAQIHLSYFGSTVVTLSGYEDSISLDALVMRILSIAKRRFEADDLTLRERITGIEITRKLCEFYYIIDLKLFQANCFTMFLTVMREPAAGTIHPSTYILGPFNEADTVSISDCFRAFNRVEFEQEFGKGQQSNLLVFDSYKEIHNDLRFIVQTSAIYDKFASEHTHAQRRQIS